MRRPGAPVGSTDSPPREPSLITEAAPPCRVAGRLVAIQGDALVIEDAQASLTARLVSSSSAPLLSTRAGSSSGSLSETRSRGSSAARPELSLGQLVILRLVGQGADCFLADQVEVVGAGRLTPGGEHARRLGPALKARARALGAVRALFDAQGFLEVETPVRVPCPGLDLYVDALPAHEGWLITSPEHHMKRLLVAGARRIYQITRASRAEELGPLHEPEFTLVEWYRAYAGMSCVMADTEALVRRVVAAVRTFAESPGTGAAATARGAGGDSSGAGGDSSGADSDSQARLSDFTYQGRRYDLAAPFLRLSVREAFRRYAGEPDLSRLAQDEDRYFDLLVSQVEPALRELSQPVFLYGYPLSQASLARPDPSDPETAERFELYLAGVELCNGFGELNDAAEQRRRYEAALRERRARGMPVYPLDERFLAALEEGMPPAGGNALGLDRLLMLALDAPAITQVLAFPTARA
ncbi:MAG: EF-P lysine aminoacylase GenX [Polyangiaceae bacterium]|nr:EF-P lysine aminoacylase GenX [Polyangiaceae bacterium]MCW5791385.1 EF-P lysine aminoacylase GenX [Polyangiaceae bacterium]